MSPSYQQEAKRLHNTYHVFEHDPALPLETRKAKMQEWWRRHRELLAASGLKKTDIEKVALSGILQLRKGAKDFLRTLDANGIPVVIMSASGLGEAIPIFMGHEGLHSPHIHYLVNSFEWDREGKATRYHEPIIHSLNKDETMIRDFPSAFAEVKDRKRVLLLGNGLGDLGMIEGFPFDKKLTIGFLDPQEEKFDEKNSEFKKEYDHVITQGGFGPINELLHTILKS